MSLQQNPPTSAERPRLPQGSFLLDLPEELKLFIVELINADQDTSLENLGSLTLTCPDMKRIARRHFFHAKNFKVFRKAVEKANVAMMNLCEEYDAAPVDLTWCVAPSMKEYRPVDALLLNLDERPDNSRSEEFQDEIRDKVFEALKWLLERGADAEANWVSESFQDQLPPGQQNIGFGHMPTRLLKQLQVNIGKRGVDVYLDMIELLSSHGFPNPTRADALRGLIATDNDPYHHPTLTWMTKDQYPFCDRTMTENYFTSSPFSLALKSHIPLRLLELMLKEYASRGVRLRDWYDQCPEGLEITGRGQQRDGCFWTQNGLIEELLEKLHASLHSPFLTHWKESYHGEVADIFREKLNIMIKYDMIDEEEEALLKSILAALDTIMAEISAAGGVRAIHFKTSWLTLCEAVRPFCSDDYDLKWVYVMNRLPKRHNRVHKFIIREMWDPWREWFVRSDAWRRLKLTKEALGEDAFSSRTQACWECHYDYKGEFVWRFFSGENMPEWYQVDFYEWRQLLLNSFTLRRLPGDLKADLDEWLYLKRGSSDDITLHLDWWKQITPTDGGS
ncbi:hypothetical protein IL306_008613 [Fusarium sp. DS 682]|nr:hypothetical protein IL306_008613 [Fusarium sp. DS 682]